MLNRFIRNATAAQRPVKISGVAATNVEFSAKQYGQLMQDRLLVFKPAVVSRRESLALTAGQRKHPVVLRANDLTLGSSFRNLKFEARAGEVLGIYGFMGCGQLELARTLFGKYRRVMREGLNLNESYAYSDSMSDLPMLSIVGHPAAVNPDMRLRQTALHHDWPILNLK